MKKKIIALFFAAAILLCGAISAPALTYDPKFHVGGDSAGSLADAFNKAKDGDTITKDNRQELIYETAAGVTVTKKVTLSTGKDFNGNVASIHYTGTSGPLFTVASGGVLTLKDATITGNTNSSLSAGELVRVKAGGTLILDGTSALPVVIKDCKLTASGTKGGAIYVEQGGSVIIRGVTFSGNSAKTGRDIYAECRWDVIRYSGVTANLAAGDTSGGVRRLALAARQVAAIGGTTALPLAADANGDGSYTAADLILLARNMMS